MGLCQKCDRFNIQSWAVDRAEEIQTRLIPCFQIVDGANSGCSFCTFLIESFMNEYPDETKEVQLGTMVKFDPIRKPPPNETGMAITGFHIKLKHHDEVKNVSLKFCATAEKGNQATLSNDVVGPFLENNPMWKGFMSKINNWLRVCQSGHEQCKKTISGQPLHCLRPELPTRCIVVDGYDKDQNVICHLEETANTTGTYVTLSHRWSIETEACKTTTENYKDRLVRCPLDLPLLFKDALRFALALGVRHVWIDSICIIQNGDEGRDWDTECLRMKNYYTNSYVTLAAGIPDRKTGLALRGMQATSMQRLGRLPYRNREGERDGYFYLYQSSPTVQSAYRETVGEGHLLKRGWVFQEWCLSRRVICFASTQGGQRIFYHCQSQKPRNEYGVEVSLGETPFWGRDDHFKNTTLRGVWNYWQTAVETYSKSQLSEPEKDRIIALAGMANECRTRLHSIWAAAKKEVRPTMEYYVAGLWLEDIHVGLLWEQNCTRGAPRKRLTSFPTWSWASIAIPVQWRPYVRGRVLAKVETVTTTGENKGYMNSTNKFTVLRLKGRLIPVIVRDDFSAESWSHLRPLAEVPDKEHANGCFEHPMIRNIRKICPNSDPWIISGWGSFEHPEYQHVESFSTAGRVYAFPILKCTEVMCVLFVRSVLVENEEQFERVGVGRLTGELFEEVYESAEEISLKLR